MVWLALFRVGGREWYLYTRISRRVGLGGASHVDRRRRGGGGGGGVVRERGMNGLRWEECREKRERELVNRIHGEARGDDGERRVVGDGFEVLFIRGGRSREVDHDDVH